MVEKIIDIDISNENIEDKVNNQLEGLFNKFLNSNKKEELKKLDFSNDGWKTKAEEIFDTRLSTNKEIIEELVVIDDNNIEKTIEKEIKTTNIDLNILENETEIKYDLNKLKNEVEENYSDKIINQIEQEPTFNPVETENLKDYIQQGKRGKAIQSAFQIIGGLFKSKNNSGFEEYDYLDKQLDSIDIKNIDIVKLEAMKIKLENKINNNPDIKKDLKFTYILSRVKDEITKKKYPDIKPIELLSSNLDIGDVILLNKQTEKQDRGTKALKAYDKSYETDFTHSAIITGTNPITIRHSTTDTSNGSLGVEEVNLSDYINTSGTQSYDIVSLRPKEKIRSKILDFSKENLGKEYDKNAAIGGGIRGNDSKGNNVIGGLKKNKEDIFDDKFNCVEIIVQGLDNEELKRITHPNEFLKYMNSEFKPNYISTIDT